MNKVKYSYHSNQPNGDTPMTQQFQQTVVNEVANQGAKVGVVWAAIGISSWSEAAAFLAFILSALALGEYVWKKILRPILEHFGYCVQRHKRIKLTEIPHDE